MPITPDLAAGTANHDSGPSLGFAVLVLRPSHPLVRLPEQPRAGHLSRSDLHPR